MTRTTSPASTRGLPGVIDYTQGRPFAWADDQITGADRDFVERIRGGPSLLLAVNAHTGLTAEDFMLLREWAAAQQEGVTSGLHS